MTDPIEELKALGKAAKVASRPLGYLSTDIKNKALRNIADDLRSQTKNILAANKLDLQQASANGINETMQDRLLLNEARLEAMAKDVLVVAGLPDGCHRRDVRKPPECDNRYLRSVPEIRQRRNPARRQRSFQL
jgi:gamma-glutamyl phosphate reductase